jgi:hypothetical protein
MPSGIPLGPVPRKRTSECSACSQPMAHLIDFLLDEFVVVKGTRERGDALAPGEKMHSEFVGIRPAEQRKLSAQPGAEEREQRPASSVHPTTKCSTLLWPTGCGTARGAYVVGRMAIAGPQVPLASLRRLCAVQNVRDCYRALPGGSAPRAIGRIAAHGSMTWRSARQGPRAARIGGGAGDRREGRTGRLMGLFQISDYRLYGAPRKGRSLRGRAQGLAFRHG